MEKEQMTFVLSVWGALLSSITFGWNLFRDVTETGRLKVTCYVGSIITPGVGADPRQLLCWNVTNVGREPVVLTHIGGGYKSGTEFLVNTRNPLPMTLKQGEYIVDFTDDLSVLGERLNFLCAMDSLGRKFKAPWLQVRKLKAKYKAGEYSRPDAG